MFYSLADDHVKTIVGLYFFADRHDFLHDVVKPGVVRVHGHFLGHEADSGVVNAPQWTNRRANAAAAARTAERIPAGARVLDCAAGTGLFSLAP